MKVFIAKVSLFISLVLLGIYLLCTQADGYTDPFYLRFTTPQQPSLILGTSRAAQGLQPSVIKEVLGKDIYNYAFTVAHSPYGPTYFESIKKKMKEDISNGIFIVTVDPWSISNDISIPEEPELFYEKKLCLGNTKNVNINPNIEYLIKNLKGNYRKIIEKNPTIFLHSDGWLDVTISVKPELIKRRIKNKVESYKEKMIKNEFSRVRLNYLLKTIEYLKEKGEVYLVRLPLDTQIMQIENEYMPDFNKRIEKAIELVPYLDLTVYNSDFVYTDGNHLYKKSGEQVTKQVAEWMMENMGKGQVDESKTYK